MLITFYEIGKYICEQEKKDPLTLSLREQFQDKGATREIALKLKNKNGQIIFDKINNPIEIDINNSGKYGILGTSKNGANLILFFIVEGKSAKKFHTNRKKSKGIEIENIIVGFEDNFINFFEEKNPIRKCLEQNRKEIEKVLLEIEYSKEENYLLTLSINGQYPNEIVEFRDQLLMDEKQKNYNKNNANSFKENGCCSICSQKSVKLVGTLNLNDNFSYFTFLENIFTRNFDKSKAYQNTAICEDCASFINFGSHYINNHFVFTDKFRTTKKGTKFIANEYYVLPILGNSIQNTFKDFDKFRELLELTKRVTNNDSQIISSKNNSKLDANEDYLSSIISELDDSIQFNFNFYSKDNAKRELKKSIKEVLPSRIRWILKMNQEIEKLYHDRLKDNNRSFYPLSILWKTITQMEIQDAEKPKSYHYSEYLSYLSAIFNGHERLSIRLFKKAVNSYLSKLIQNFEKIEYSEFKVLDLFYLDLFFNKLGIYYDKEEIKVDIHKLKEQFEKENSGAKFVSDYWAQFITYPEFFNTPEKCFAFLMGKLMAETRYTRKDTKTGVFKGSFIDGWLSNFSTNIYKLHELMERCIETLAIEGDDKYSNKLIAKQNNILTITTFFTKLTNIDKLLEKHEDLIFPFVTGFCFWNKKSDSDTNNVTEVK